MKVDAVVVGQGLAGTLLSYFLMTNNKSVLVIDSPDHKSASMHSSGVVNPITGRRFVKSWLIDEILPFAKETYQSLELLLDKNLIQSQQIKKIIHSVEEINNLSASAGTQDYLPYLSSEEIKHLDEKRFHNPYGYFEIHQSFRVDVKSLLSSFRSFLEKKGFLMDERFDYRLLDVSSSTYKNICFDKLIFCEGYRNIENPFFKYLPVKPNKGQYLLLDRNQVPIESTVTGAGIISPLDTKTLYAGATYEWQFEDDGPTEEGLKNLKTNIDSLVVTPYDIIAHKSGIRPTSPDRRPMLGAHPEMKNLAILNGFGAKGTSLAPYFAEQLVDHLWNCSSLNPEVDILRYKT